LQPRHKPGAARLVAIGMAFSMVAGFCTGAAAQSETVQDTTLEPMPSLLAPEPAFQPIHANPKDGATASSGTVFAQGKASWYGKRFHGRRTASGEIFDMNAMTAAHRTLPFGTMVRVRSMATGREVVVRINDRGPFSRRRIIDLSQAAARELGVRSRGVTEVQLFRE
jgi:rare lipoprotein A